MSDDPAKSRFLIIQLARLGGVALVVLGLAIIAGKIALPQAVGYGVALVGVVESLIVPQMLARRWKSPRK